MKRANGRIRRVVVACLVVGVVVVVTGCRTISFYAQAAKGQIQLLRARESIEGLMESTNTPTSLKSRLEVLEELREFAETKLALPVDGHYRQYADVHRPFVLWNVEAAPEFSMTPKSWWYPLVGNQQYRGYFARAGATNYADYLRSKRYDTYIGGVPAYSTLGWFKDAALNTFVFYSDADLAELIFHELSHQEVFARSDTDFNEAFATAVGQEGARRWLKEQRTPEVLAEYEQFLARNTQFVLLITETRTRLEALYGDERDEDGELKPNEKQDRDLASLQHEKKRVFLDLVERYNRLKATWGGDTTYDQWFSRQLNNAKLNSVATYYDLVPGFQALLDLKGGNLPEFYAAAQRLADMPKKDRREWLQILAAGQGQSLESGRQMKPAGIFNSHDSSAQMPRMSRK